MPLVLHKMPKVCPVAAQVITFKNDGAVALLLGVFILLQNIHIITGILLLVSDPLALSMLTLVAVGIAALNICWFWWQLILWYVDFSGSWYYGSECMLVLRFADPSLDQDSITDH